MSSEAGKKPDIFTEAQRDDVCNGKLCPKCLDDGKITNVGHNFDGMNANMAYDCSCGAQWEGY